MRVQKEEEIELMKAKLDLLKEVDLNEERLNDENI